MNDFDFETSLGNGPNDPKLSECGGWRSAGWWVCAGVLACAVTAGAIRCSAWLGVAVITVLVSSLIVWRALKMGLIGRLQVLVAVLVVQLVLAWLPLYWRWTGQAVTEGGHSKPEIQSQSPNQELLPMPPEPTTPPASIDDLQYKLLPMMAVALGKLKFVVILFLV